MNNIEKNNTWNNITEKPSLSKKTNRLISSISALTWLILALNVQVLNSKYEQFQENQDNHIYEQIKNDFYLSTKWFVKAIEEKNPELVLSNKLKEHENTIIEISMENILNNKPYFYYNLSKENIDGIEWIIESLVFLMDSMYWKWYSSILKDLKDHSDKILVVDIMEINGKYILRKVSIENNRKVNDTNNVKQDKKNLLT